MEKLKQVNLYNLIKIIAIMIMFLATPIVLLHKSIKKYVQVPVTKLIRTMNI